MIIGNTSIDSLLGSSGSTPVGAADEQAPGNAQSSSRNDSVSLSNAANLGALAKTSVSPAHQAKLQSITSQVHAGQYQTDNREISRAVIGNHLQQ